jgi:phage terminase large subunit-like protein
MPPLSERERAEAELARRSCYDFFLLAFPEVCKGRNLVLTWHLRAICDHLQALAVGHILNLLINVPPRHMKSLLVSVFWAAWLWIRNPSLQLLFASKAQGIALRDNRRTRQLIESPWFQARWSVTMVKDQNAKGLYINTDGGQRQATSSNSEALGIDADILVGDDFHGLNDSADEIDKVVEWIEDTFWSRGNDVMTSPKVVIGQQVRGNDISNNIIRGKYGSTSISHHLISGQLAGPAPNQLDGDNRPTWTCLILPMEYEPNRHCRTGIVSEGFPLGFSDPRTVAGELLAPGRYSQEWVDKFRETKPGTHARINQQNPTPREGGIFKRAWMGPERQLPRIYVAKVNRWGTSCDSPFRKGKATDFYVHQLIAEIDHMIDGERNTEFIIVDQKRARKSWAEMEVDYPKAIKEWRSWGLYLYKNLVEAKGSGDAILSKWAALANIVPFEPGKDSKEQRYEAVAPKFRAGQVSYAAEGCELVYPDGSIRILGSAWLPGLLEELATAENADHDDQADTITQYLLDAAKATTPEPVGSTFEELPAINVYAPSRAGRLFG